MPIVFPNNEVFDIILRSRNSRNYVSGNYELQTKEKENPASQPIENSRITAGFFRYSRITRSISAESRITQNPFQTLANDFGLIRGQWSVPHVILHDLHMTSISSPEFSGSGDVPLTKEPVDSGYEIDVT